MQRFEDFDSIDEQTKENQVYEKVVLIYLFAALTFCGLSQGEY